MTKMILSITLQIIIFTTIFSFTPVLGQDNKGDYVNYSFKYTIFNSDDSIETAGNVNREILDIYDNGSLRIKTSGNVNNVEFSIIKNSNGEHLQFPYLISVPSLDQKIKIGNLTLDLRISRSADEVIEFQGTELKINVSQINIQTEHIQEGIANTVDIQGEIKLFSKSGLLYHLDVEVSRDSTEGESVFLTVNLEETSLDPTIKPEFETEFLSRFNDISSFAALSSIIGEDFSTLASQPNTVSAETTANQTYFYLIGGGLGATIVAITIMSLRRWNNGRKEDSSEEKPLHWVN
jgi:hypothetical protein